MLFLNKSFKIILLIFFFLTSCVSLPGIVKNPSKKKLNQETLSGNYTMDDVGINIIGINSLTDQEINKLNENKIDELDFKVKNFSNIYNYKYEYILGASDTVSINLTDTDDLDGTYLIDEMGMIDLPFIGKVKLDNLTLK